MSSIRKPLRDAATLLIASKCAGPTTRKCDYRVLLMQRSKRSNFMPESYVFPGGVLDTADYHNDWLKLLSKMHEKSPKRNWRNLLQIKGQRPAPMLKDRQSLVSNEIALRICAIRETFEESGVLVLRSFNKTTCDVTSCEDASLVQKLMSEREIQKWKKTVHDDATKFMHLCRELECVPDIWSLQEWYNWITPIHLKTRFDTLFYTCFFSYEPNVWHDEKEMIHFQWSSPDEALELHSKGEVRLGPPQFYEMGRFSLFSSWEDLRNFSVQREQKGCESVLASVHLLDGSFIGLMPGDYIYEQAASGNLTDEEIRQLTQTPDLSQSLHRQIRGPKSNRLLCYNYTPKYGHCLPLTDDMVKVKVKSKL